jgi:hypothetical protein
MLQLHRWQAVVIEATQAWLETIVNGSSSCASSSGASACVARGSHPPIERPARVLDLVFRRD